jgi:hypothetical protein
MELVSLIMMESVTLIMMESVTDNDGIGFFDNETLVAMVTISS